MWARLGRFSFRRRRYVLGAWIAVFVAVFALVGSIGASSDSSFSIPDSESKRGFDTLDEYFGGQGSGRSGTIVFLAEQGVNDPEVQAAMTELFDEVDQLEGVTVTSPYSPQGQIAGQVATEGELAGLSPTRRSISTRTCPRRSRARSASRSATCCRPTSTDSGSRSVDRRSGSSSHPNQSSSASPSRSSC
jgi:predicted RND superfamily exporter protein